MHKDHIFLLAIIDSKVSAKYGEKKTVLGLGLHTTISSYSEPAHVVYINKQEF